MKVILDSGQLIELGLTGDDVRLVELFIETTADATACTHGPLDMQTLITMLLEDVALMISRPGSWEGSNMSQVMSSHGYSP
jgi:hypothetical protein